MIYIKESEVRERALNGRRANGELGSIIRGWHKIQKVRKDLRNGLIIFYQH